MKSIFVTKHSKDGYALYPDENENGVRLSESDHLELFECLTKIYPEVIHKVSKSLQNKFEISPVVIDAITKHTIIPLLNVFFDITTRIGIAVNVERDVLNIIKMVNIEPPSSIDEFSVKAKNDEFFNQFLIYYTGSIWNLAEASQDLFHYKVESSHQHSFVNHMSRFYPRTVFNASLHRIKIMGFNVMGRFFNPRKYVGGLSYLFGPFVNRGMFVRNFKKMSINFKINNSNRDESIRRAIFTDEIVDALDLEGIFNKINLTSKERASYKRKLVEFLRFFYPLRSLEMLPKIVDFLSPQIEKYNNGVLVNVGGLNTDNCYLSALLKDRGFVLVRLQHGGYTGYYEFGHCKDYIWTKEFNMCDYYLTWGWSTPSNKADKQEIKFIPFASPWISERKKYWSNWVFGKNKSYEFDVLIAPTRLAKFYSTNWQNTVDEVNVKSKSLIYIVQELKKADVTMLYKIPSISSANSYSKSMNKMIELGGEQFTILENIDKGLEIDLVSRVSIILWDVVGFGFLECIACRLPTMVFLESYLSIENNMKELLYDMEKVGIIHTSVASLVDEMCIYKQNPQGWMSNLDRIKIINKVTSVYCNTDNNWDKSLMQFLHKLEV